MEGSKAPDKEFKDFKNHVLHVGDDFWGGAPEKVESWYKMLVRALEDGTWSEAVWAAGIMSHYYTDPIHPFHTAQSPAENEIHRAVEWSISKSYDDLWRTAARLEAPAIKIGTEPAAIKDGGKDGSGKCDPCGSKGIGKGGCGGGLSLCNPGDPVSLWDAAAAPESQSLLLIGTAVLLVWVSWRKISSGSAWCGSSGR